MTLAELGVPYPKYQSYDLLKTQFEEIQLPDFPCLIKTSHGLSGEGTYIIGDSSDLNYCKSELRKYLDIKLVEKLLSRNLLKILYRITVFSSTSIRQER